MGFEKKWENPGSKTKDKYHGIYNSWYVMLQRAGNKDGRNPTYADVSVCERWLSYDNFFQDMSDTWWDGATLDKDIIKPGNRVYCKEYCKWVPRSENIKERNERDGNPMKNPEARKKLSKALTGKRCGILNVNSKKVKCIETGVIYYSTLEAERELHLPKTTVSNAANPKSLNKTAGGYHWVYVEE